MMARRDGTDAQDLTSEMPNVGFPSWSHDSNGIVFRSWGLNEMGLRILNLQDHSVRVFTDSHWEDAMPCFVPKVERVAASQTEPEKKFGIR
jgi:hypothetical protein